MRRREKFLLSSLLLAFGLLSTQYVPLEFRILAIALFFFVTYGVSAWALFEDLNGVEWLTVVPLPGMYAVSVALFYFLLPENVITRIIILALFGVGMYALYLTANIFTVAKTRTIQLLRAAHAVALLFGMVMSFFVTNTIFSLHLPFWANGLGAGVVTFPLALMLLWSIELKPKLERPIIIAALSVSVLIAELALVLSFFPATVWMQSLYVMSMLYICLGMLTTKLAGRLFQNTVWEYLSVWVLMTGMFFFLMKWK